jgi:uncharacterized protein (DUF1778 family)
MRQQSDSKRGPDMTIRFSTKRAKDLIVRAARKSGQSVNRWAVSAMCTTAVEQLEKEAKNGNAS